MALLEEIRQAVHSVSRSAGASVVGIRGRWSVGSGVVVGPDRVLTNAHNVGGDGIEVSFTDGRTASGNVAGADVDGDLALVAVDVGEADPIRWSEGNGSPSIGTPVFALSNPGGMGLRVTFGLVTGTDRSFRGPRGRRIGGSIEHTSPLLPGSSGGPVVDASGRLLGINTNRLGEGFYLAIPAGEDLRTRLEGLERGEVPARPRLGIGIAPPQVAAKLRRAVGLPEVEGLLVRVVEAGSAAERAGISEGDLLVEANGRALDSADRLHEVLDTLPDDGAVELKLLRGAEERQISLSLEAASGR